MSSKWTRLHLKQKDLPVLLFQYTWTRQGYELFVTDLTSVWLERLSEKEIVKRAENSNAAIDPGESLEQLEILLVKIGEALRGDGGRSVLSRGSDPDSLELTITTKLPAPLKALEWTLPVKKEPTSSLMTLILLPLLKEEATWKASQQSILEQLKQKDWVLGRLFDKLGVLGLDLATVFPSAAGLRTSRTGNTRSEASKYINGLAPFDESVWLTESGSVSKNSGLASNLVHELVGSDRSADIETIIPPSDRWWCSVPAVVDDTEDSQNSYKLSQRDLDMDSDQDNSSTASEDDFEEQENLSQRKDKRDQVVTPPFRPAKKPTVTLQNRTPSPGKATESESESESEPKLQHESVLNREHTPSVSPPPKSSSNLIPKKPKAELGVIGGKRKLQKQPSPQPTEKLKRPSKLGLIGGKAKSKVFSQETNIQPEDTTVSLQGKFKGEDVLTLPLLKREKPQTNLSVKNTDDGPSTAPETDEQMAQRKREELKRRLDAQTKAPKKRRF